MHNHEQHTHNVPSNTGHLVEYYLFYIFFSLHLKNVKTKTKESKSFNSASGILKSCLWGVSFCKAFHWDFTLQGIMDILTVHRYIEHKISHSILEYQNNIILNPKTSKLETSNQVKQLHI